MSNPYPFPPKKKKEQSTYEQSVSRWLADSTAAQKANQSIQQQSTQSGWNRALSGLQNAANYRPTSLQEYNPEVLRDAEIARQTMIYGNRNSGNWDVETNTPVVWSDNFLSTLLDSLPGRIEESKAKDSAWNLGAEQRQNAYAEALETAERWKQLYDQRDSGYEEALAKWGPNSVQTGAANNNRWYNWLMADYLLGDRSAPFDFEAINARYDAMSDEEYYAEEKRLDEQFQALDWETLMNPTMETYDSQTATLEALLASAQQESDIRKVQVQYDTLANSAGTSAEYAVGDSIEGYDPQVYDPTYMTDLAYFINHAGGSGQQSNLMQMLNDGNLEGFVYNVSGGSMDEDAQVVARYYAKGYNMLYPWEVETYNKLYNSSAEYGPAMALGYLDALGTQLTQRRADLQATETQELVEHGGSGLNTAMKLASVSAMIPTTIHYPLQIVETLTGKGDHNSWTTDASRARSDVNNAQLSELGEVEWANKLGTIGGQNVLQHLYGAGTTALETLFGGAVGGPRGVLAMFGAQSASNELRELQQRGDVSDVAAVVQSALVGALEVGTEKIGLDKLLDTGTANVGKYLRNVIASELGEEVLNDLGSEGIDLMVAGIFDHEAELRSGGERANDLLNTIVQTAISTALLGGGSAISMQANQRSTGKAISQADNVNDLISLGESFGADTDIGRKASELKKQVASGKKPSYVAVGRFAQEIETAVGEKNAKVVSDIADEAIAERMVELGDTPEMAKKNASAVRKIARGETLTLKERAAVSWSDNATQVVKELASEAKTEADTQRVGQSWKAKMNQSLLEAGIEGKAQQAQLAGLRQKKVDSTVKEAAQKATKLVKGNKNATAKNLTAVKVAYDDGTGKTAEGDIKRFEAAKDGHLQLVVGDQTAANDKHIDVDDLKSADGAGVATIVEYVNDRGSAMPVEEANTMLQTYAAVGGDVQTFINDFDAVYGAAYSGMEAPSNIKMDAKAAAVVAEAAKKQAAKDESNRIARTKEAKKATTGSVTYLGEISKFGDISSVGTEEALSTVLPTLTKSQQNVIKDIKQLARATKVNVALFDSKGREGVQHGQFNSSTNTVYVDISAGVRGEQAMQSAKEAGTLGYAMMRTLSHELTHYIEANSADGYARLKSRAKSIMQGKETSWNDLVREKITRAADVGQRLTRADAEAEVIADACENILQDSKAVETMAKGDPSLKKTISSFVKQWMNRVRTAFQQIGVRHREAFALMEERDGLFHYMDDIQSAWDEAFAEARANAANTAAEEAELSYSNTQYSISVRDKETIEYLDNQQHITTYRAMQMIDGGLYPPMAEFIGSKKTGNREDASALGRWEMAAEHPELIKWVDGKPKFELKKTNDDGSVSTVPAAYNPYMHSSNTVLNDQFSKAFQRDNLVVVECVVPVSESDGAYRAQYAKDATGWHEWKSGVVAGDLAKQKSGFRRDVFLSRYIKPVRILSDTEVAEKIAGYLDGTDVTVPFQAAWPTLREALVDAGVKVTKPRGLGPAQMKIAMEAFEEWKRGRSGVTGVQFSLDTPPTKNAAEVTEEEATQWLKDCKKLTAQSNTSYDYTYVPLRASTPRPVLAALGVKDAPVVMNVGKARQAMMPTTKAHKGSHGHGYSPDSIIRALDACESPEYIAEDIKTGRVAVVVTSAENADLVIFQGNQAINPDRFNGYRGTTATTTVTLFKRESVEDAISYLEDYGYIEKTILEEASAANAPALSKESLNTIVRDSEASVKVQNSLDDSAGVTPQTETEAFKRWFGKSKVVNPDGTPKVMYHGTPNGTFTVFKEWQYFTDNKAYADIYQNQGASSSGYKSTAQKPTTYAVYLKAEKPFDTRNAKERRIFMTEFYRKWGNGTPLSDRGLPDWTDADDLIEFFEENEYDYDSIVLDEGGTGGYGEEVKDRGISWVIKDSKQIKSATDNVGTFSPDEPDIRYSLPTRTPTVSLREYMVNLEPSDYMNDVERDLLTRYKAHAAKLAEIEANITKQEAIVEEEQTTDAGRAEAQARLNILRTQSAREVKWLEQAEGSKGFARLMADSYQVVNNYLRGEGLNVVADATDRVEAEIASLTEQLKTISADLEKTSSGYKSAIARGLLNQQELNRAAMNIKNAFSTRMQSKEIADRLALAYSEMYVSHDSASFLEHLRALSEDVLRKGDYRYKSEALEILRSEIGSISLGEQEIAELKKNGVTLSQFKKTVSPYLTVSEGGDDLSALASNYSASITSTLGIDESMTPGDLAMHIYDLVRNEKAAQALNTLEGMDEEQSVQYVMLEMVGANIPLADTANSKVYETLRQQLMKGVEGNVQLQAKVDEAIRNAKSASGAASSAWRKAYADHTLGKQAMAYYQALADQRRLMDLREQKQNITQQLKSDAAKKLQEVRNRYYDAEQQEAQRREIQQEIGKHTRHLKKVVGRMNDRILHEEDYKNVKQELQPAVRDVVKQFIDSFGTTVFDSKQAELLSRKYALLDEGDNEGAAFYAEDVKNTLAELERLAKVYDTYAATHGKGMTLLQQAEFKRDLFTRADEAASAIWEMVKQADDVFVGGKRTKFETIGQDTGEELLAREDKKRLAGAPGKIVDALDNMLRTGNLTPLYFFEHLGNKQLLKLWNDVLAAQTDYSAILMEAQAKLQEAKANHGYYRWSGMKPVTYTTQQGHTVTLSAEHLMSIYATAKREATNLTWTVRDGKVVQVPMTEHLREGGFKLAADTQTRIPGVAWAQSTKAHKLSDADVANLAAMMPAEMKAFVDDVVGYMTKTIGSYGNEAAMELYGIEKYNEEYYFPFKTASDERFQRSDAGSTSMTNDSRVKHMSASHRLTAGARNPIVIGNFTDTVSNHINQMAMYSSYVLPVESLNRVLNYTIEEEDGTKTRIRALLERKYGANAQKYVMDLLRDINGTAQTDNRGAEGFNALFRTFKRGAVAASLSTAVQQPTAYVRAFAYISPQHFLQLPAITKRTWNELTAHSGTARIKDMGKFEVGMGKTASQWVNQDDLSGLNGWEKLKYSSEYGAWSTVKRNYNATMDFVTGLPGWMDQVTWGTIWNAVKAEQRAENPGMDPSSEEFLDLCGKRFDEVINHTQVYDSVLAKSANLRSTNALTKMSTAFMSEPILNINMLASAFGKNNKGRGAKMVASVVLSQIFAAAAQAAVSAWSDDDDERKASEKYLSKLANNLAGNLNPATMIPYLADAWDIFVEGYDPERLDLSVLSDIASYSQSYFKAFENGGKPTWKQRENFYGTLANLVGIPAKNISRDVRRFNNLLNSDFSEASSAGIKYSMLDALPFRDASKSAYYERYVGAVMSGNKQTAYDVKDYTLNSLKASEDAFKNGVRAVIKKMVQNGEMTPADATKFLNEHASYANPKDNTTKPQEWAQ